MVNYLSGFPQAHTISNNVIIANFAFLEICSNQDMILVNMKLLVDVSELISSCNFIGLSFLMAQLNWELVLAFLY